MRKLRKSITARKVLDSALYIICRLAEDVGIQDSFISALDVVTNIREAVRGIVILEAKFTTVHMVPLISILESMMDP